MNDFQQVGQSYLDKHQITLDVNSSCWQRPHAHVDDRKICKMDLPKTRYTLFDFLHEVGHIVHPYGGYKKAKTRALAEWNATQFAIEQMRELGVPVPTKRVRSYNRYVKNKIARGLRRGLKKVPSEIRHLKPKTW